MNHESIAFLLGCVFMLFVTVLTDYRYRNLLIAKSKAHEVEFINGEPIVLVPESDYIEMVFKKEFPSEGK